MLRYLKEAFWARPTGGGIAGIPWNVVALAGATLLGFGEPAVWLGALGAESLYLYLLASNPRFQRWVDAVELERLRAGDVHPSEQGLVEKLAPAVRARIEAMEKKVARIEELYRESDAEDYIFDTNREALRKLVSIYARLLVAQRNLLAMGEEPGSSFVQKQIKELREELARGVSNAALRESKEATLRLLHQRAQNSERRHQSLAEIDSDLTRIETQIELALEDASLRGRPTAISSNIDLVSHLLIDDDLSTTTETTPSRELEN